MTQQALAGSSQVSTITDEEADIRQELVLDLEETCSWRRRLIAKYPDDQRLTQAVEILERVIPTVAAVPNLLLLQYDQMLDSLETDEELDAALRAIGFKSSPASAQAFIEDFIADPKKFVKPIGIMAQTPQAQS
jgi:hypothetical protein